MKCFITVRDEVWCSVTGLSPAHTNVLWDEFGVFVDGYFFMPQYKLGRWDGKIRFFEKTGKTYMRLLDKILPFLDKWGYDIELVDNRKVIVSPKLECTVTKVDSQGIGIEAMNSKVFGDIILPNGHAADLRPYQVQCLQNAVEAGSGFIIAGTGAGKTLITAAISYVYGEQNYKVITIVPSGDLVSQTYELYEQLGLDVGVYSGESKDIDHLHVIATWQALQYNPTIMQDFHCVIWDECFAENSLVLMGDHTWKKISDVKIGDAVISMSDDGIFEVKSVTALHQNLPKSSGKMLSLTMDNGAIIEVTEDHEFFTARGKVKAKDLTDLDEICEFSINKMKIHGDKTDEEERNK